MQCDPDFEFGEGNNETMRNMIAAMIHDFVDAPEKPDMDNVIREMEKYLGGMPSLYRSGMIWLLRALEVAPFAMGYRQQYSKLPREDQVKVLQSFENGSNYVQRMIIVSLKGSIIVTYFSEPEMERTLGYDHHSCLVAK